MELSFCHVHVHSRFVGPKQEYHWCSSLSIQIVSRKRIGYLFFFWGGVGERLLRDIFVH